MKLINTAKSIVYKPFISETLESFSKALAKYESENKITVNGTIVNDYFVNPFNPFALMSLQIDLKNMNFVASQVFEKEDFDNIAFDYQLLLHKEEQAIKMGLLVDQKASIVNLDNAPGILSSVILPNVTEFLMFNQPLKLTLPATGRTPITNYFTQLSAIARSSIYHADAVVDTIENNSIFQRFKKDDHVYEILQFQFEPEKYKESTLRIKESMLQENILISMLYNRTTKRYKLAPLLPNIYYNNNKDVVSRTLNSVDKEVRKESFSYRLYWRKNIEESEQ